MQYLQLNLEWLQTMFRLAKWMMVGCICVTIAGCGYTEQLVNGMFGGDEREQLNKEPYVERRRPTSNPNYGVAPNYPSPQQPSFPTQLPGEGQPYGGYPPNQPGPNQPFPVMPSMPPQGMPQGMPYGGGLNAPYPGYGQQGQPVPYPYPPGYGVQYKDDAHIGGMRVEFVPLSMEFTSDTVDLNDLPVDIGVNLENDQLLGVDSSSGTVLDVATHLESDLPPLIIPKMDTNLPAQLPDLEGQANQLSQKRRDTRRQSMFPFSSFAPQNTAQVTVNGEPVQAVKILNTPDHSRVTQDKQVSPPSIVLENSSPANDKVARAPSNLLQQRLQELRLKIDEKPVVDVSADVMPTLTDPQSTSQPERVITVQSMTPNNKDQALAEFKPLAVGIGATGKTVEQLLHPEPLELPSVAATQLTDTGPIDLNPQGLESEITANEELKSSGLTHDSTSNSSDAISVALEEVTFAESENKPSENSVIEPLYEMMEVVEIVEEELIEEKIVNLDELSASEPPIVSMVSSFAQGEVIVLTNDRYDGAIPTSRYVSRRR